MPLMKTATLSVCLSPSLSIDSQALDPEVLPSSVTLNPMQRNVFLSKMLPGMLLRVVPVNSTHPEYDAALPAWLRSRDVLAGEDAAPFRRFEAVGS